MIAPFSFSRRECIYAFPTRRTVGNVGEAFRLPWDGKPVPYMRFLRTPEDGCPYNYFTTYAVRDGKPVPYDIGISRIYLQRGKEKPLSGWTAAYVSFKDYSRVEKCLMVRTI